MLNRKLKGWFFRLGGHHFVPSRWLDLLSHLAQLSAWISAHRQLPLNDFYTPRFDYGRRYQLFAHLVEHEQLTGPLDYLEFGVAKGASFRWWSEHLAHPGCRLYGFDTFTGLPEDWGHLRKGDFSTGNEVPQLDDSRAQFFQGLFQQTLPTFLREYEGSGRRRIIHLDADLYSATLYVLTTLYPHLRPGDVLLFDEFNVPQHEFKAFKEWTDAFYVPYQVLAAVNNYYQTAIRLS